MSRVAFRRRPCSFWHHCHSFAAGVSRHALCRAVTKGLPHAEVVHIVAQFASCGAPPSSVLPRQAVPQPEAAQVAAARFEADAFVVDVPDHAPQTVLRCAASARRTEKIKVVCFDMVRESRVGVQPPDLFSTFHTHIFFNNRYFQKMRICLTRQPVCPY